MLTSILAWVGSLVTGPALDAYKAHLAAGTSADQIAKELALKKAELDAQQEQLEQATLVAEEGKFGPWIRWGFAIPFVLFNLKAIVWDRMFHMGVTDPLSPELLSLEGYIIAAYFGHSAVTIVARVLTNRK